MDGRKRQNAETLPNAEASGEHPTQTHTHPPSPPPNAPPLPVGHPLL